MMENVFFDIAWRGLLSWFGVPEGEARQMRSQVLDHYRKPDRAYHTLGHAVRVLGDAKSYAHRWGVQDYGAVQLAALLHDVIYDPRSRDNEARSADFAQEWGRQLGFTPSVVCRAAEIILATRHHGTAVSADAALVVDADLAVLAAPWQEYDAYRRAIRREYAWVAADDWVAGRGRVLTAFLDRDRIYHLPALCATLEIAARENLERELSLLSAA